MIDTAKALGYLARIADALEKHNELMTRMWTSDEGDDIRCPACGSVDLVNSSTMGDSVTSPKMTCGACNEMWVAEVVNG